MEKSRKPILAIFLLAALFIGFAMTLNVLHRPCRHCLHPPHVEKTCGIEIKGGGIKGNCSCKEDR